MSDRKPILLINRRSISGHEARAIRERVIEPLEALCLQEDFSFQLVDESTPAPASLSRFKLAVLSRPFSAESLQWIKSLAREGVPIIIDLDDIPIFRPSGQSSSFNHHQKKNFLESLSYAQRIVCSTSIISEWVKAQYRNAEVTIIETGFNFSKIESVEANLAINPSEHIVFTNAGPLKLGKFLNDWLELMSTFLIKNKLKLAVYADNPEILPRPFPLTFMGPREWLQHKREIRAGYLGAVVPLAGNEDSKESDFASFKSPTKFICYSGLGIPAVYSKVSLYENLATDRAGCFLAQNTREEWTQSLELLVSQNERLRSIAAIEASKTQLRFGIQQSTRLWKKLVLDFGTSND
jgi:hypothetical protein